MKRFGYFCMYKSVLVKQFKAKLSKWHRHQIITSKTGNSPKALYKTLIKVFQNYIKTLEMQYRTFSFVLISAFQYQVHLFSLFILRQQIHHLIPIPHFGKHTFLHKPLQIGYCPIAGATKGIGISAGRHAFPTFHII